MAEHVGGYETETSIKASLGEALEHGIIVSNLAYYVAKEMGCSEEICKKLAIAGILHDIGKLKLNDYVNEKNVPTLEIDEIRYTRYHPSLGYALLKDYGYDNEILEAILYHHESVDGSGYPNNLKGEEIPLGARILRVCDAFGALLSNRAYREGFDTETALSIMIEEVKGFDIEVFLAFLSVVRSDTMDKILI